jgi:site-specific DNA-methyltransferase (adenine-specific)
MIKKISEIVLNDNRRKVDESKVKELAESIKQLGLINPITVNSNNVLIAGNHRLEAFKLLGKDEIEVSVLDLNNLLAELAEIDENLVRNELHWTDADKQIARRKIIYLELYPDTKKGAVNQHTKDVLNENFAFSKTTANLTNQSKRTIEQSVKRGIEITKEEAEVLKTIDAPKSYGDILIKQTTETRAKVIDALKVESKPVEIIIQEIKKEEKKAEYKEKVLEARIETKINESIKQGNSLEILETLEDGCIDIVLTDPPYGIDYVSNRSTDENAITKRGLLNDGKDEAFDLLDKTCEILQRKTAVNSHLYFFCSWSVFSKFEAIISKYFTIKTPIVWDKGNKGSGDLDNDWGNQTEIIIYCVKGKKLINNRRGNLISVSRLHTSKMIHPTQKPNELIKEILEVSFNEGDFVVDPFMGSGSTIKVCQELKAKCLGIELDKEMFNIANNYINGN